MGYPVGPHPSNTEAIKEFNRLYSLIIWDKIIGQIPRQMSHYKLRYEPILYGSMGLHRLNAYQDDVIQCQIDRGHKRVHPTQKPVSVIEYLLKNSTNKKSLVLDPFLGSGTTTVACKHLGIRCIGIEIEEKYCELAAKRVSQEMVFETDNKVLQPTTGGAGEFGCQTFAFVAAPPVSAEN
jgi:DNA modification methylase